MNQLAARIGAIFYVVWGIVHINAAYGLLKLGQSVRAGMVQARIYQDAWNILFGARRDRHRGDDERSGDVAVTAEHFTHEVTSAGPAQGMTFTGRRLGHADDADLPLVVAVHGGELRQPGRQRTTGRSRDRRTTRC